MAYAWADGLFDVTTIFSRGERGKMADEEDFAEVLLDLSNEEEDLAQVLLDLFNEEEEEEALNLVNQNNVELLHILQELLYQEEQERLHNNQRFRTLNHFRRTLRDLSNPFDRPINYFVKFYRMDQTVTLRLIRLVENDLLGERSTKIPVHLQVLITLRFMAEGSYQRSFSQDFCHPVGQSIASKCIRRVQNAILNLHNAFIKFPTTPEARQAIQHGFQRTLRIPGVIGAVDCFLVTMKRPAENEEAFYNYRVGSSMNVQIILDSQFNILNIRICPGTNNGRFVWQFSQTKDYLEYLRANPQIVQNEGLYYIIADSGYTPSPTVLTPVLDADEGTPPFIYTTEHVGTRRLVEQTIGILTNVWQAIKRCRALQYSPEAVARIISVACILHNFRRRHGIIDGNRQPAIVMEPFPRGQVDFAAGIAERTRLINEFYT